MVAKVKKLSIVLCISAVLAVAVVVLLWMRTVPPAVNAEGESKKAGSVGKEDVVSVETVSQADADAPSDDEEESGEGLETEEPRTEEELREEAEEKAVDAFDALTDKWMEKEESEVSMKDMDEFVRHFKSVPDNRKEECLQRALNLVSDGHVLLLAGVLFDKTIDKELVELVFNDVLNRDESVKKLILPMIYKDKEHPCWADTAWILDVTGELPTKEGAR